MSDTTKRRRNIIDYLCRIGNATTNELAARYGVSRSTIVRDLTALSFDYPIYTLKGNGGGVYMDSDYIDRRRREANALKTISVPDSLLNRLGASDRAALLNIIDKARRAAR